MITYSSYNKILVPMEGEINVNKLGLPVKGISPESGWRICTPRQSNSGKAREQEMETDGNRYSSGLLELSAARASGGGPKEVSSGTEPNPDRKIGCVVCTN